MKEDTSRKPPSVGSADVPDAAVAAAFGGAGGGHPADRLMAVTQDGFLIEPGMSPITPATR